VLWFELAVGIASQNDGIGLHLARRGFHNRTITMHDVGDRRLFKNLHAEIMRGSCLTDTKIQRMEVAITVAGECAEKGIGAQIRTGLFPVPRFILVWEVMLVPLLDILFYIGELPRLQRSFHKTTFEITIDAVLLHAVVDDPTPCQRFRRRVSCESCPAR